MIQLTKAEEMQINAVAGSVLGTLFRGAAMSLKGAGTAIQKGSGYAATGLRFAADGIEIGGGTVGGFLHAKGEKLQDKADDMDETVKLCQELAEKLRKGEQFVVEEEGVEVIPAA